jgi:hypothetical protein
MNKLIVLLLLVVSGCTFKPDCKKIDDDVDQLVISVISLKCTIELTQTLTSEEICKDLGRPENCKFIQADKDDILFVIDKRVENCRKEQMRMEGFCVD